MITLVQIKIFGENIGPVKLPTDRIISNIPDAIWNISDGGKEEKTKE